MGLPLNHRLQLGHHDARRAARRASEREAKQQKKTNGGTGAAGLETTRMKGTNDNARE